MAIRPEAGPRQGPVKAPVLLWGPYLWADGVKGRKADGLTWSEGTLPATGPTQPRRSTEGGRPPAEVLEDRPDGQGVVLEAHGDGGSTVRAITVFAPPLGKATAGCSWHGWLLSPAATFPGP